MSKITQSAKGKDCIRCGSNIGVCARHYNGFRQHSYGKGRSIKCDDLASAELCSNCDALFTEGNGSSKDIGRSEEFLHWCMMTNIRRMEDGVIKVA